MTLQPVSPEPHVPQWVSVLSTARQMGEVLAGTSFVPKAMRDDPNAVCAAILYANALDLDPMVFLSSVDVVEGKPRPSSELARALILRAGHTLTVHEATGTRVRVSGLRAGRPESERVTVEWTTDMARAAGLLNKSNWRSYPRAMLMARATGDLSRILFPDVIKGLGHIAETADTAADLDTWAPDEQQLRPPPPDDRPAPAQIGRRRPTVPRPRTEPPDVAPAEPPASDVGDQSAGTSRGLADTVPEAMAAMSPEAPADPEPGEPSDALQPMRETQRRGMFAAIGRLLGDNGTRDVRLALVSAVLGRPVATSTELTRADATNVLSWLDDMDKGLVSFAYDPADKTARVWRMDDQPDPWADVQVAPIPEDPWSELGGRKP